MVSDNHEAVMVKEVINNLILDKQGSYIDCTFGGGGYSQALLKFPGTKVLAIDRDKFSQKKANLLLKKFPKRFNFFKRFF